MSKPALPHAAETSKEPTLTPVPAVISGSKLKRLPLRQAGATTVGEVKRHSFRPKKDEILRVTAATGVPGTSAELPPYLRGPSAEDSQLRTAARTARARLAQAVTLLQQTLPEAAQALKALEDAGEAGAKAAATQGLDIAPARALLEKLGAALKTE